MRRRSNDPTAPVGQQASPARAAASALRALRSARGPLLLITGTVSTLLDVERKH
jgi:hypothetical protein